MRLTRLRIISPSRQRETHDLCAVVVRAPSGRTRESCSMPRTPRTACRWRDRSSGWRERCAARLLVLSHELAGHRTAGGDRLRAGYGGLLIAPGTFTEMPQNREAPVSFCLHADHVD